MRTIRFVRANDGPEQQAREAIGMSAIVNEVKILELTPDDRKSSLTVTCSGSEDHLGSFLNEVWDSWRCEDMASLLNRLTIK